MSLTSFVVDSKPKENRRKMKGDNEKPTPGKPKKDDKTPPKDNTPQDSAGVQPATNPRLNKDWAVPAENYTDLHFAGRSCPRHTTKEGHSSAFCIGFHVRGTCNRGSGCKLTHLDPRDVDKATEFAAFLKPFQTKKE